MGKGDIASKNWLQDKVRYADLFNGILFDGKQVIKPEELEIISGESDIVLADKDEKIKKIQRYRDIVMKWRQEVNLAVCACENQQNIHYAMPVRIMLYDGLSYTEQIEELWKKQKKKNHQDWEKAEKKKKGNQNLKAEEWLSHFRKDDRLLPVITIVFYYGSKEWDAALSLHDMLDLPQPLKKEPLLGKYIPNYSINLVNAGNMEHIERFQSDLQLLFEMLKCRKEKDKLPQFIAEHKSYFENIDMDTFWAFGEFLQAGKQWDQILSKNKVKEEKIDMCNALQDWYDEGVEHGFAEGKTEAFYELLSSGIISMDVVVEKLKKTREEVLEGMQKAGFSMQK